jgi:acyl-CoA synthetase (NDP forming)
VENLKYAFNPSSIAVIGASRHEDKVGYNLIRKLREDGYKGKIYAVNPRAAPGTIYGEKVFRSVTEIDGEVDLAVIVLPSFMVKQAVRECVEKGAKIGVIVSSGFKEVGAVDLQKWLTDYCRENKFPVIGPNLLGLGNPHRDLNLGFTPYLPLAGNVAVISQSGANLLAWLGMSRTQKFRMSFFVGMGNMADIGFPEMIAYADKDDKTDVIALYIEGIPDRDGFIKVCKNVDKPIVAITAGALSERGKKAAGAHTGSEPMSDEEYDEMFEEAGIIRVKNQQEFVDVCKALSKQPVCNGGWMVITNGGGSGLLITDESDRRNVDMVTPSESLKTRMKGHAGLLGSPLNPVDLSGMAIWSNYKGAIETAISSKEVGGVVVSVCPTAITYPEKIAAITKDLHDKYKKWNKPIIAQFQGGEECEKCIEWLNKQGIPAYLTPERAVSAMKALSDYNKIKKTKASKPPTSTASEI